jgi:hypothetical protein
VDADHLITDLDPGVRGEGLVRTPVHQAGQLPARQYRAAAIERCNRDDVLMCLIEPCT